MDINKININIDQIQGQSKLSIPRNIAERGSSGESHQNDESMISKENMRDIADTLNSAAKSVHQRVAFSYHEKTNRVIMKFIDPNTEEVTREIPPKEMIRLLEHIHDLIGMFVDESR